MLSTSYGANEDFQDLSPIGPGTTNCSRFYLADPIKDPIVSMTVYVDAFSVQGIQMSTKQKVGSFGRTDLRDGRTFYFSEDSPMIGIWGFNGPALISGLGVIKYDTKSECY